MHDPKDCQIEVLVNGEWVPRWWRPAEDGWAKRLYRDLVVDAERGAVFVSGECASEWMGLRLISPSGSIMCRWLRPEVQAALY